MSDIKLSVLRKLMPFELQRFRDFETRAPGRPLGQRLLYALGASVDPFGDESIALAVNTTHPLLWKSDAWWDLWNAVHDLPWRCLHLESEMTCTLETCLDFFDWLATGEGISARARVVVSDHLLPGVRDVLP